MHRELKDLDFQRFWHRLQNVGLTAYEARTYIVLLGHVRFKALELAARANVPRQKIYEVLDTLAQKGFTQVVQEKTKLFSAVAPGLAIPNYLAQRQENLQTEFTEQTRVAGDLVEDLSSAYSEGQEGRGTLDYLRIVNDPGQIATQYRRMIAGASAEYLEFSRPPYAVDPLDEKSIQDARARGVRCCLLLESNRLDPTHRRRLTDYQSAGVEVRQISSLPMKLALFDSKYGMIALLDPLVTKPTWTAVTFDHPGMGEAMKGLFDTYWSKAKNF